MADYPTQSGPQPGQWPPPVPGYDGRLARPPFISQLRRQRVIAVLAVLDGITDIYSAAAPKLGSSAVLAVVDSIGAVVTLIVTVALAVVYLLWVSGTYRNLDAFRTAGKSTTPGWAVGFYFVPFLNLYRPFRTMGEVWRASDPSVDSSDASAWRKRPTHMIIVVWWTLWILYNLIAIPTVEFAQSTTPLLPIEYMIEIADVLLGLAGLLAMFRVVGLVNERQEAKEKTMLEQDPEPFNMLNGDSSQ